MYTTCEADKRRSVNHTRALALLAGPGRAEAEAVGVGVGEARPAGRAMRVRDVTCGAVRRDVLR